MINASTLVLRDLEALMQGLVSLEYQPVLIVSVGWREQSGDSAWAERSVSQECNHPVNHVDNNPQFIEVLYRAVAFSKLSYILVGKAPMNILFLRVRLNEYTLYPHAFRPTTEKYAQSHQTVLSRPRLQ